MAASYKENLVKPYIIAGVKSVEKIMNDIGEIQIVRFLVAEFTSGET